MPPPRPLCSACALCDEHGIMLIADEVQSGAGRTGTLFAMEQMGVAADITTFANPSPAVSAGGRHRPRGGDGRHRPGGLGGTYAGNPIACAAARRYYRFSSRRICWKSQPARRHLRQGLLAIAEDHPEIGDVRGLGR